MAKPELMAKVSSVKAAKNWAMTKDGDKHPSKRKNADMIRTPAMAKRMVQSSFVYLAQINSPAHRVVPGTSAAMLPRRLSM
jgi:hypothetical protein